MWFERLTGFREETPAQVRAHLAVDGEMLRARVGCGSLFCGPLVCGALETPSLAELRERMSSIPLREKTSVREIVADVQQLHTNLSNAGAMFQVASQFNLLEMVSPRITPEQGVGIYENDRTQGPACAIAAGAGTIYRNYFACVDGNPGQTADSQIDCLRDLGSALGNSDGHLWEMENGYALASLAGLEEISARLRAASETERDRFRGLLRIGVQWRTQVTLDGCAHLVSQVYGSALPVAYSAHPAAAWSEFARLVLEASYEATFCAAILNSMQHGSDRLFLTLLGGGAFGNDFEWIVDAIDRALRLYPESGLDLAIVSYGSSKPHIQSLVGEWRGR